MKQTKRNVCSQLIVICILPSLLLSIIANGVDAFDCASNDTSTSLKVGAFNIKSFGRAKMRNQDVRTTIVDIVNRYDIVLIQEVRDKSGAAINTLWSQLNSTDNWGMVKSERLGRSQRYKEQYVFFYRTGRIISVGSYQDEDPFDIYEREPFSVQFVYISNDNLHRIVLLGLHAKPDDVPAELNQLPSSIGAVSDYFSVNKVIAMGDFNADCSYASSRELAEMDIFQENSGFVSLIPDTEDTTQSSTHCAYDRIVVYGDVNACCGNVYNFQEELNLSPSHAKSVSDHYPVEFELN